jgi:hypothetical protein
MGKKTKKGGKGAAADEVAAADDVEGAPTIGNNEGEFSYDVSTFRPKACKTMLAAVNVFICTNFVTTLARTFLTYSNTSYRKTSQCKNGHWMNSSQFSRLAR